MFSTQINLWSDVFQQTWKRIYHTRQKNVLQSVWIWNPRKCLPFCSGQMKMFAYILSAILDWKDQNFPLHRWEFLGEFFKDLRYLFRWNYVTILTVRHLAHLSLTEIDMVHWYHAQFTKDSSMLRIKVTSGSFDILNKHIFSWSGSFFRNCHSFYERIQP